jgi:hypothetical protein
MLIEDYLGSKKAFDLGAQKMIYSLHFPNRDPNNVWDKWVGWLQYTWYCQYRPLALKVLAVTFAVCSVIVVLCELCFYLQLSNNPLHSLFYGFADS